MDIKHYIEDQAKAHQKVAEDSFRTLGPDIAKLSEAAAKALQSGHKLLFFGNGGSAADAQHIAAEFVVRLKADRKPLPALALTVDTSILTACANDYGQEFLFSRQVEALGQKGDVAVGISTSGNSINVIRALEAAKAKGLVTVGLLGNDGGKIKNKVDLGIVVPSTDTMRIQEMHIFILHVMCGAVEKILGYA